jgi:hypothetical protein
MFEAFMGDLTLATTADYDRLVRRLQAEAQERSTANTDRGSAAGSRRIEAIPRRRPASRPSRPFSGGTRK